MVRSLLRGRGGAQLVAEEFSSSRRSPSLQSKMGVLAATKEMKSFPIIGDLLNFFLYVYITFAEYTVVDSACAVKLSPDVPFKKMSLLSCGVSTGLGAAWNTANVKPGSTLAIIGLGAVGLAAAEGARSRGASRIIGVDINPNKFVKVYVSQCRQGVTEFINPKELDTPLHEKIREMTQGGVDYSPVLAGVVGERREAKKVREGAGFLDRSLIN
ncbi:hypothetical protein Syun_019938 [Stephania yunnanensis]|uniref:Alcohol dehydrogenase-like C-terminal domain-containing protein n=1 Tax=Stephania yunnanensis TaxID=152371 RepID=A0AAP0NZV9_9MAGN